MYWSVSHIGVTLLFYLAFIQPGKVECGEDR